MTLYEEVASTFNDYPKFYRFEGWNIFTNYDFFNKKDFLLSQNKYIYFSRTYQHHLYYVSKRINQLIGAEILKEKKLVNKNIFIDTEKFQYILGKVEKTPKLPLLTSIEFKTSPLITTLFEKNVVMNVLKKEHGTYIERVDVKKYDGGYGMKGEWLEVFNLLTYFYRYIMLDKTSLIDYLHLLREYLLNPWYVKNAPEVLFAKSKSITEINPKVKNNFSKYELMESLLRIMEQKLYFPNSYLAKNPKKVVKKVVQTYTTEKEQILETIDSVYKRNLKKL